MIPGRVLPTGRQIAWHEAYHAAALCIAGVRSTVVNLGMYGHFALSFGGALTIAPSVWALTAFVLPFSLALQA